MGRKRPAHLMSIEDAVHALHKAKGHQFCPTCFSDLREVDE